MDQWVEPAVAQIARQQRRAGGAIHIVVAEDRGGLVPLDGVGDARGAGFHSGEHVRIRKEPLDRRIEEALHLLGLDAASREDTGKQFRQIVALCNGERPCRAALIEPVAPSAAANRLLDPEKQPARRLCRRRQRWHCHDGPAPIRMPEARHTGTCRLGPPYGDGGCEQQAAV